MSHQFPVPTNENGMILDPYIDSDVEDAMGPLNERLHAGMRPRVGSSRERWRTPRSQWLWSSKHQVKR